MRNMYNVLESADKRNDFDAIRLTLASPEKIRAWSYGEVRVPETINYRTFKPETSGLFCAKIFGPIKDYECLCGKYKRKSRGVVCDKCGVEVTQTRVRRERMGHIDLACPVAHILFFKALPSRIGLVLDLTMRDIERILYFETHVIIHMDWDNMQDEMRKLSNKLKPLLKPMMQLLKKAESEKRIERIERELAAATNLVHPPVNEHVPALLKENKEETPARQEAQRLVEEMQSLHQLEPGRLLSVEEYADLSERYPRLFAAGIGAEGVRDFLKNVNLEDEAKKLRLGKYNLNKRVLELIFQGFAYLVVESKTSDVTVGRILDESEEGQLSEKYGDKFKTKISTMSGREEAAAYLEKTGLGENMRLLSDTRRKKIFKRLKIIESFQRANLRPEWMVLEKLPVMPPDLRPLVQLEGGRFTNSDLNDLYRRVINRNNRLKRLMELGAPDVIINNEKRMLQESVDSLLDNGRRGKPAVGTNRRPLKSVADIIKGKSGRFRQNLLGKRVDFSGRSVVVVGPDLKLHQCGLPKRMALTLFRPFVFNKLTVQGLAGSMKAARTMVDNEDPAVWGALEEVIAQHPVLLNRAPTLHRLGVQAFEPVLIEGKAIQLHPLVCVAFNADFDGDQMAVHVPLSIEAQAEARVLMLSSNNILAPANGEPIIVPTQDVVLGLYYATREDKSAKGAGMRFADVSEVERALAAGAVSLQTPVEVLMEDDIVAYARGEHDSDMGVPRPVSLVKTTAGRALVKRFLPDKIPFSAVNKTMKKADITLLIKDIFGKCGQRDTVLFCDRIMRFGFERATRAGISVCMSDMKIPEQKAEIIKQTEEKVRSTHEEYQGGVITEDERYNKSVDLWDKAGEQVTRAMMKSIRTHFAVDAKGHPIKGEDGKLVESESFNSIYMMADSGARGSETQIKQLAGMRGLMTKPDGRIMENAITANFREGLSVLQYFISTHGARKGLSDTALKTANSGYLTRRLVDVTQDIIISELDCGSERGITMKALTKDGNEIVSLADRIVGRTLSGDVLHPQSGNVIYSAHQYITEEEAKIITEASVDEVKVRSPVTCKTHHGLCVKCYGRDLGRGGTVCLGEAVGVVAAQSIGEPGTQLTMRTFHIGGAASRDAVSKMVQTKNAGTVRLKSVRYVENTDKDLVVVSRSGELSVHDKLGSKRESHRLQYGQVLKVADGTEVKVSDVLSMRDPMVRPIVAEHSGIVKLENMEMGVNAREQIDDATGLPVVSIMENKHGGKKAKTPQMKLQDKAGSDVKISGTDTPVTIVFEPGSTLSVREGQKVYMGDLLSTMPQKAAKSRDITGGLPRVAELFEAREPKEPSILAKKKGRVALLGMQRSKQVLAIVDDEKRDVDFVQKGRRILFKDKSEVRSGEVIVEERGELPAITVRMDGLLYLHARPEDHKQPGTEVEVISADFHHIAKERVILVQDGSLVERGDEIVDGEINSHEILAMRGEEALVEHIVHEVQDVYRLQGVNINDKHIEVIIHQMMRSVYIIASGDSEFIPGDQVMRSAVLKINETLEEAGKRPTHYRRLLLGITKSSLSTDSFISAASFQETSRVLTEAAVAGREDMLRGLKENVIVGRLVPAGTGFVHYQKQKEQRATLEGEYMMAEAAVESESESDAAPESPPSDTVETKTEVTS